MYHIRPRDSQVTAEPRLSRSPTKEVRPPIPRRSMPPIIPRFTESTSLELTSHNT